MKESFLIFGMDASVASIIIPTVASIVVFVMGYIINSFIKCFDEANERRRHRENVIEWIKFIKRPLNEDIKSLKKFSEECANNTHLQPPSFEWLPLLGNKFEQIIDNSVLEGFYHENKKYESEVFSLISQSSFLSLIEKEIRLKYDEYSSYSLRLMERWNSLYGDTLDSLSNLINYQLPFNSDLRNFLIATINNHNDKMKVAANRNNFILSYDTLITPIATSVYSLAPEMKWFNIMYGRAIMLRNEWESLNDGYSIVFRQFSDRLESSLSIINDTLPKISGSITY